MRAIAHLVPLLVLVTAVLAASPGRAGGINHFEAAPGPHNYVVTNHPAVLPHLMPSTWMLVSYAKDPLVFRDDDGAQVGPSIVEHQLNVEIAAALGLFDRFELGVVAPAYFMSGAGVDGDGLLAMGTGDLRVNAKALLTPWNDGFVSSFRLQSDLIPVAQLANSNKVGGALAGDVFPNVTPALTVGFNNPWIRAAADVGMLVRVPRQIAGKDLVAGSQVTYGVGLEVPLVPKVVFLTGDLNGRIAPRAFGSDADRYPLEADGAIKSYLGPVLLMVGGGTGLIPDYGAPDFRVFAALGWYDRPAADDKKPEAPKDSDKDGILDANDECPEDPEDLDQFEDEDGCPELDNDKDGIHDADDGCPLEPEDKDRWQDDDGCPEDDNDGDGVADGQDECPNDPEVMNGFEDEDGCPDEANRKKKVIVKRDRIEITDKVYFAYDSDRILPKSYELLDNVAKVINEHTEIPMIFVEGHTDSDGKDDYNLQLSDRRAKSVMRYLIDNGSVASNRVKAEGFGEARPIADNSSEEGKATNRRVEFRIVDADGGSADMTKEQFKSSDDAAAGKANAKKPDAAAPADAGDDDDVPAGSAD